MSDIISPGVMGYLEGQAEAAGRIADLERRLAEAQTDLEIARSTIIGTRDALIALGDERDALKVNLAEALTQLAPANPQETLIGAIRNLQQAYISAEGNCETLEVQLAKAQATQLNSQDAAVVVGLRADRDVLQAALEQAREALNDFSRAFFEFATAAVRDTEEPFIPKHLSDLYGVLVRRAQTAESVLAALNAGRGLLQPIQQGVDAIIPPRPQVHKDDDAGKEAGG